MKRKFLKSSVAGKLTICVVMAAFVFWTFLAPLSVCFCAGCTCPHNISTFFPPAKAEKSCCCEKKCCGGGESKSEQKSSVPAKDSGCECGCSDETPAQPLVSAESPAKKIVQSFGGFPVPEMPLHPGDSEISRLFAVQKMPADRPAAPPVRLHLFLSVLLN